MARSGLMKMPGFSDTIRLASHSLSRPIHCEEYMKIPAKRAQLLVGLLLAIIGVAISLSFPSYLKLSRSTAQPAVGLSAPIGQEPARYDQPDEALEYYRLKRLPAGEDEIPVERYLAARERMQRMRRYSTAQER